MTLGNSFELFESPLPKDAPCQISMHFGQWFMRKTFLKIYQKFLFAPYWAPKEASLFIWTNPTNYSWNWPSGKVRRVLWREILQTTTTLTTPTTTDDGRIVMAKTFCLLSFDCSFCLTAWYLYIFTTIQGYNNIRKDRVIEWKGLYVQAMQKGYIRTRKAQK